MSQSCIRVLFQHCKFLTDTVMLHLNVTSTRRNDFVFLNFCLTIYSGPHRPAWPRFGEYTYLPPQRWLHALEVCCIVQMSLLWEVSFHKLDHFVNISSLIFQHGGVVMLYHPCAHPLEVERLRRIVTSCLFHHVISANRHLTSERVRFIQFCQKAKF